VAPWSKMEQLFVDCAYNKIKSRMKNSLRKKVKRRGESLDQGGGGHPNEGKRRHREGQALHAIKGRSREGGHRGGWEGG